LFFSFAAGKLSAKNNELLPACKCQDRLCSALIAAFPHLVGGTNGTCHKAWSLAWVLLQELGNCPLGQSGCVKVDVVHLLLQGRRGHGVAWVLKGGKMQNVGANYDVQPFQWTKA
jgi:hypothetical protein